MKNLIGFCFLILLVSCQQVPSIQGKWKLVKIDYSPYAKQIDPSLVDSFLKEMEKQSMKIENRTFFDFGEILTVTSPAFGGEDTATETGTWEQLEMGDSLKMVTSLTESFAVSWKTQDTMMLSTSSSPDRIMTLAREKV
jgi:hypothetical protein